MGPMQLSGILLSKCTSFLDCRVKTAIILTCAIEGIVTENLEAGFLSFSSSCHLNKTVLCCGTILCTMLCLAIAPASTPPLRQNK